MAATLPTFTARKIQSSQFGEEGLIDDALNWIGIRNRWCFEVGAADGRYLSNTLHWRDDGWEAVLIDANQEHFESMWSVARNNEYPVLCRIGPDDIDRILGEHDVPTDLDLGVLDIDGQDWHCWEGMKVYRPRLMLVEVATHAPGAVPPLGGNGQAGIGEIDKLAATKKYTRIGRTHCNGLYVANEEIPA
tara:strand:+ start:846 stop:1415 length:570 start_codon:yes stop_codon:yes gene_type:complete